MAALQHELSGKPVLEALREEGEHARPDVRARPRIGGGCAAQVHLLAVDGVLGPHDRCKRLPEVGMDCGYTLKRLSCFEKALMAESRDKFSQAFKWHVRRKKTHACHRPDHGWLCTASKTTGRFDRVAAVMPRPAVWRTRQVLGLQAAIRSSRL